MPPLGGGPVAGVGLPPGAGPPSGIGASAGVGAPRLGDPQSSAGPVAGVSAGPARVESLAGASWLPAGLLLGVPPEGVSAGNGSDGVPKGASAGSPEGDSSWSVGFDSAAGARDGTASSPICCRVGAPAPASSAAVTPEGVSDGVAPARVGTAGAEDGVAAGFSSSPWEGEKILF